MTGVLRHPSGPRVYLAGRRVHHGSSGIAVLVVGLACGSPTAVAAGIAAVIHDRKDFPFRDCDNH